MNSQVMTRIQQKIDSFSKGQKRIGNYILEHYDKVAFMTAARLGATVGVSESTVVRFATEIGYGGYPELQRALQEMIRTKMTSFQRLEMAVQTQQPKNILREVLSRDVDVIRKTMEEADEVSFYRAADAIAKARKVYIIGVRSSNALATFLSYYLNYVCDNVVQISVTSVEEIYEQLMRMDSRDTIIGISFPRYSTRAVKALAFAAQRGAQTVAITDTALSPLAEMADHVLLARSDMASFVDTLVAPLSLINALLVAVAVQNKEEVSSLFQTLEDIWDTYDVYEKVEEKLNG